MAHGFNSFMGNKDFHPGSFRNLKKVWEAGQQLRIEEKKQEELKLQYLKEQEQYQSKELMGKANPLSFMYEPPPAFAKDTETKKNDDDDEPKLKFDWQKEDKAPPRESYAKDMNICDQPFGIEVRHVRCIKCGKLGHVNTDRECSLFGKAKEGDKEKTFEFPIITNWDALDDGLKFKQCAKDRVVDDTDPLQQFVHSDDETEMIDMLAQFSPKQRKRILKKLAKAESKGEDSSQDKKKKHKHKRDRKSEMSNKRKRKHRDSSPHKHRKSRRRHDDDCNDNDSSSSDSNEWVESKRRHEQQYRTENREKRRK